MKCQGCKFEQFVDELDKKHPGLKIAIIENGVKDALDFLFLSLSED